MRGEPIVLYLALNVSDQIFSFMGMKNEGNKDIAWIHFVTIAWWLYVYDVPTPRLA